MGQGRSPPTYFYSPRPRVIALPSTSMAQALPSPALTWRQERIGWITLFNGIDNMGFVLAWEVNIGPSKAFFQNTIRPIDSESFSLDGAAVVPEPGTWILVGTGIFGIAGTIRRKLTVTG